VRTIKVRGWEDLDRLKGRVKRVYALKRIDKWTYDTLIDQIEHLERMIVNMRELNQDGEEEG